jgi:hypothetical protein
MLNSVRARRGWPWTRAPHRLLRQLRRRHGVGDRRLDTHGHRHCAGRQGPGQIGGGPGYPRRLRRQLRRRHKRHRFADMAALSCWSVCWCPIASNNTNCETNAVQQTGYESSNGHSSHVPNHPKQALWSGSQYFGRMTHMPPTVSSRNRTLKRRPNTHLFQRGRSFKASVCRVPRQLCPRAGTSLGQGRGLAAATTTVAGNGGVTEVVND